MSDNSCSDRTFFWLFSYLTDRSDKIIKYVKSLTQHATCTHQTDFCLFYGIFGQWLLLQFNSAQNKQTIYIPTYWLCYKLILLQLNYFKKSVFLVLIPLDYNYFIWIQNSSEKILLAMRNESPCSHYIPPCHLIQRFGIHFMSYHVNSHLFIWGLHFFFIKMY